VLFTGFNYGDVAHGYEISEPRSIKKFTHTSLIGSHED
jgi:hypothetical protein